MSSELVSPERISTLQGLELTARLIVEGYLAGLHRSPYRGLSIEFAEHREYSPGDDLRYVDWKVFGKTDRIYLKQFDEETNFACHLLVDTSESMTYRSAKAHGSKLDYGRWAAAALAYLVIHQRDAAGLATFDTAVKHWLPPASTALQLREVCRVLEESTGAGESSLGPLLEDAAERLSRRGVVVLLSDLFDDFDGLARGLKHLHYRRQDVVVLQILDPAELDFPFTEPTLFHGLEQRGDRLADPRSVRQAYLQEFQRHQAKLRGLTRDLQFDYALLRTDQPLGPALAALLARRRRRY
jgi:uncharacterized protein (DUF58 family)